MKKILIALNLIIWSLVTYEVAHAEAVMKSVCREVKGKQVCKTIKTHKKVEGTKVPEKTPAPTKNKK